MDEWMKHGIVSGNKIKVFMRNGFKYQGKVVNDDGVFISIIDSKDGKNYHLNRTDISVVEVIE